VRTKSATLALSRYRNDDAKPDWCAQLQAAATTSRHVLIAAVLVRGVIELT
jgi:hypothetical protein